VLIDLLFSVLSLLFSATVACDRLSYLPVNFSKVIRYLLCTASQKMDPLFCCKSPNNDQFSNHQHTRQ